MDLWTSLEGVKVQVIPFLETAQLWLAYGSDSAWLWFILAMLAGVWIARRFVVKPLSRLIEFRTQVTQMERKFHTLANELRYVRLAVDELHALGASLEEKRDAIDDVKLLSDELRVIVNSLVNERAENEQMRSAVREIRSVVNSLKTEDEARTGDLRVGLDTLIRDYEQAGAD